MNTCIRTDVLVIGGGLAALCAALEARMAGKEVALACKRKAGRSGNTVVAACNISGVFDLRNDAVELFADDIVRGGEGIGDAQLARTLAEGSTVLVPFLQHFGVRFLRRDGALAATRNPGHSAPRTVTTLRSDLPVQTAGLSLTLPLLAAARQMGVRIIEDAAATELLGTAEGVGGALFARRDGERLRIESRSVVLACGGAGRLFAGSNNTAEMTGDGIALAYRVGAELRDLEFIQFHPTMGISPVPVILPTTLFADGALLRNAAGERFLLRDHPAGEGAATRDVMSRAIWREVAQGRGVGGGVHLDLSEVSPEATRRRYGDLWDLLRRRGCAPERDSLVVGLAVHFFMGGMTIDADGASTVPGLFGAGEVTGGVHGANRLGGNALAEAVVFGRIAGRSAAERAGAYRPCPLLPELRAASSCAPCPELDALRHELRSLLWHHAGVERSQGTLEQGLCRLQELERRFETCAGRATPGGLELERMLLAARLILLAALRRTESRGAHHRSDFPTASEALRGSLRIRKGADAPQIAFTPS